MTLVIKGAVYFDGEEILIPHFTGEYQIVDCDRFCKLEELENYGYNEKWLHDNEDNYITYNNEKYYFAEYSPYNVEDWLLLSDLSELEHVNDTYEF